MRRIIHHFDKTPDALLTDILTQQEVGLLYRYISLPVMRSSQLLNRVFYPWTNKIGSIQNY
ncbi:hypothetical protein C9J12_12095 [Photobacterium frigidiphilum]|uniref:Uncharacterized protein n=1 Tax=Photobacterium frigidiphilum TaxID=264736 RepID=A0A2T3JHB8_9GAMM|nr:hypothetical protein C9J12_12095 [Photobacterium frigidiphilum]